jgi:hypothetical protein
MRGNATVNNPVVTLEAIVIPLRDRKITAVLVPDGTGSGVPSPKLSRGSEAMGGGGSMTFSCRDVADENAGFALEAIPLRGIDSCMIHEDGGTIDKELSER